MILEASTTIISTFYFYISRLNILPIHGDYTFHLADEISLRAPPPLHHISIWQGRHFVIPGMISSQQRVYNAFQRDTHATTTRRH